MNLQNRPQPVAGAGKRRGRRRNRLVTAALALLAGAAAGGPQIASAETTPPSDFFPIGVWLQPTTMFQTWKSRGVNTMVGCYSTWNVQQWNQTAMADGLYMIRQPLPGTAITQDITNPYLLAWAQCDEPDSNGVSAAALQATYNAWKKVDPNRPVYLNFSGGSVLSGNTAANKAKYQAYMAAGDWISNDIYPVTGWDQPDWIDYSKTVSNRKTPGIAVSTLSQWSGGKAQYAFIETSNQRLSWTPAGTGGVNASQFRGEVWDAIINGARGIFYFPQAFNGFTNDATPPAVVTEMTKQDHIIESLGAVLNSGSTSNPQTIRFRSPTLEGTWREYHGQEYYFVLNLSSTTVKASMDLPGLASGETVDVLNESRSLVADDSALTDTFTPDQVHIYEVVAGETSSRNGSGVPAPGGAVPEPSCLGLLGTAALLGLRRRKKASPAN